MKKTLLVLGLILSFAFLYAQNAPQGNLKNVAGERVVTQPTEATMLTFSASNANPTRINGRDVILSENFNTTPSQGIPAGWVQEHVGSGEPWIAVDALYAGTIVTTSPDGTMFMTNLWNGLGPRNAWLISSGFTLTAGEEYEISFYLRLAMFAGEVDKFRVNIGQAQTAAAMLSGDNIYENTTTPIADWTVMTFTYTPTVSGTFYLGFHAFSDANMGNDIDIEDVLITGAGGPPPPDCDPAKNLAVAYSTDCSKAELTWDAPAKSRSEVLWDNTNIQIQTSGLLSQYWAGNDNWIYTADDFDADAAWTIETVTSQGFSNAPSLLPTSFRIIIYENNAGKPGTEIYISDEIPVSNGGEPVITLPTPFTLPGAGKYWITIAGWYNASVSTNGEISAYRWNIYYGTAQIGLEQHLFDKMGLIDNPGGTWKSASALGVPDAKSMYFKIEGTAGDSPAPFKYNVYRDGVKLTATPIDEPNYTDSGFDVAVEHIWKVTVVCPDDESDPIEKALSACFIPVPCNPITGGNAELSEAQAILTWTAVEGATGYKVTRGGNVLGTPAQPTFTETAEFLPGTPYTWTVTAICASGEADGVDITGQFSGIDDTHLASFTIVPNPAQNEITISAGVTFNTVEVINFLGQTVISQTNNAETVKLDISNLNNGVYFVRLVSENGISVKKFVKQ